MSQASNGSLRYVREEGDRPVSSEFEQLLKGELKSTESLKAITEAQLDSIFRHSATRDRSMAKILRDAKELATLNPQIAEKCMYSVPRDGKQLIGPSIRLAEIMASCWGHITVSAQKIADDGKVITVQATAIDTISGVCYTVPVDRKVTKKGGQRFSDDMVIVATNAAISIAIRNAINRVVPGVLTDEVLDACKLVMAGDVKTIAERRKMAVQWFIGKGAKEANIYAALGVPGIEDIGIDELAVLTGIRNEINDNVRSIDQAFPEPPKSDAATVNARLSEAVGTNGGAGAGRVVELPPAPSTASAPSPEKSLGDANAKPPEEVVPPSARRRGHVQPEGLNVLGEPNGAGSGGGK